VRQLTRGARFADEDPDWSPDGTRLAFVREDEFETEFLYTMNADGTGARFLLQAEGMCCPAWSPDGRFIALSLEGDIVVLNANGGGRRLISGASSNTAPSWSPDGKWIAFDSNRGDDWDIFVASSRGGPARRLTTSGSDDEWPDWSPDGRLIAFSRGDLTDLEGSIYVMSRDGRGVRRVPLPAPSAIPSWQPVR
jgi:TolB protein